MLSFKKNKNKTVISGEPIAIEWAKTESEKYYNLLSLNPDEISLSGVGGVYVVWYSKHKTVVVFVGVSDDLALSINQLKDHPQILEYHQKGDIGITWAPVHSKYRNQIASYTRFRLSPLLTSVVGIDDGFKDEVPLPVTLPFNV